MFLCLKKELDRLFLVHAVTCLFIARVVECQQTGDDVSVLKALGDHGDRIADLENIVKQLKSDYKNSLLELYELRTENIKLREEIENLGNQTNLCCQKDSLIRHQTSTLNRESTTTTSPPTTLTTPEVTPTTTDKYTATSLESTRAQPTTEQQTTLLLNTAQRTTTTPTDIPTTSQPAKEQQTTAQPTTAQPATATTTNPPSTTVNITVYTNCDQVHAAFPTARKKMVHFKIGRLIKTVSCEYDQNGAWLVVQRRRDGSVNFNRKWVEYQNGFGNPSGEFWIGNEFLHQMTSAGDYTLRIDFEDWAQNTRYAQYEHFAIGSLFDNYRLSVGSYTGTAGDSFHYPQSSQLSHHRMMFSTPDQDNDNSFMNCADKLKSGWWFNSCYSSNLNGRFLRHPYGSRLLGEITGQPTLEGTGVEWYPYRRRQYSFKMVTMKLKLVQPSVSMIG